MNGPTLRRPWRLGARTLRAVVVWLLDSGRLQLPLNFVAGRSGTPDLTDIEQAKVVERELTAFEHRDWRAYFAGQLSGKGLEIGPLHRPMVRHDGMDIDYLDHLGVEALREQYPELAGFSLVDPDILDDAQTLESVADERYDFVIAAHVIEHMKNPLRAIENWMRVVRPGGKVYVVAPDKRSTFDRKRVRTSLEHMVLDYQRPSASRDYEHFLDYAIHVQGKAGSNAIREADRLVEMDYSIHCHVFIPGDLRRLCEWFSRNIDDQLAVVEGPCLAPDDDEFHVLLAKR